MSSYGVPVDQDWLDEEKEIIKQAKEIKREKNRMKRVIVESPYRGNIELNEAYGELAMHDCLVNRNESPYASHLLYTRKFVLNDKIMQERELGINAGFCWRSVSDKSVFYVDLGITDGMEKGITDCKKKKSKYEIRKLPEALWCKLVVFALERGMKIERNVS